MNLDTDYHYDLQNLLRVRFASFMEKDEQGIFKHFNEIIYIHFNHFFS